MTLKRTPVTNDDGVTRETLVDDERVQPEDERPLPHFGPLGLLPHSNWTRPPLDPSHVHDDELYDFTKGDVPRQPGFGNGWIGIGTALAIVAGLVLLALVVLRFSGCAPPPEEALTNKPPRIGIPDKPKPGAIAWAGTLDVATRYPAELAGAHAWTLIGQGLEWAPVTTTAEIVLLVGPRGKSILIPVAWCADSVATQDVGFHRDWKERVDYRWTRR